MQYVRSIGGSVSKTWNSINPATLSGAIDVIVVELEDGSLACSPFHVRFGKFSLLRPYEKKVEFRVNEAKQKYSMKLGEGGEAFFVFETSEDIPESLQTSPVISPASSPPNITAGPNGSPPTLQEPEFLDLNTDASDAKKLATSLPTRPAIADTGRAKSDSGALLSLSTSLDRDQTAARLPESRPSTSMKRSASAEILPTSTQPVDPDYLKSFRSLPLDGPSTPPKVHVSTDSPSTERSASPPPISADEAVHRARTLSEKLSDSNIPSRITDAGDLMLDMNGYKSSEQDVLRAEVIARKILAEELEGNYDIGALIGADEQGNLWIYSSEEAKEEALRKTTRRGLAAAPAIGDAISDPGYNSDDDGIALQSPQKPAHQRTMSDAGPPGLAVPSDVPSGEARTGGDSSRNFAKTLRLTSEQLKALHLKPGANSVSFSVNRATCQAFMYYWKYDVPIVISDIDGTITKSDALGHVLNMIGRDWTHIGVAKLYTDIVANGYHILYLTSRSVGQADTTRAYLNGVMQEGFRLPKGPVIMSPDRTIAALRREIYLRKPEVFKMACLRDILNLFSQKRNPFYAGFGNRLTDALSYRSVNIPSTRIFTINSNAEVSLDLLTLNKYKSSYVTMREVVDHFFPPVGLLVTGGAEEYTDFTYWRETPKDIEDFTDSEGESLRKRGHEQRSLRSEDEGSEGSDDDQIDELAQSYISQDSTIDQEDLIDSIIDGIDDESLILGQKVVRNGVGGSQTPVIEVEADLFQPADEEAGSRSTRSGGMQ